MEHPKYVLTYIYSENGYDTELETVNVLNLKELLYQHKKLIHECIGLHLQCDNLEVDNTLHAREIHKFVGQYDKQIQFYYEHYKNSLLRIANVKKLSDIHDFQSLCVENNDAQDSYNILKNLMVINKLYEQITRKVGYPQHEICEIYQEEE